MFFTDDSAELNSKFENLSTQIDKINTKIQSSVVGNMDTVYTNLSKQFVTINDNATKLMRSMGGVLLATEGSAKYLADFRNRITEATLQGKELGISFKDSNETIAALASSMGRMVNPSTEVISNMTIMAKSTGLSNAEIGGMVANISKFKGTQAESLKTMSDIAMEARKTGINTADYMKNVNAGLKKASGFGFKEGIEGVKTMAKQAAMLRTSIESIGAKSLQDTALDPEGAIEAAAKFQMLGGAVGKLADPFQLMRMAQTDMAGLQDELVKSTSSAFKFNNETGRFEASTQDLYRLREQAKITGANFDEMAEAGKEAAKLDFLKNAVDLKGLKEEQQGLITSLAQIGSDGKITVDIPGFDEIDKNTGQVRDLATLMKDQNFTKALGEYQLDQAKSEKDIAIASMTIEEDQLQTLLQIEQAVIAGMDINEQTKFRENLIKASQAAEKQGISVTDGLKQTSKEYLDLRSSVEAKAEDVKNIEVPAGVQTTLETKMEEMKKVLNVNDALIPSAGSSPTILSKGAIYKGIASDDVAVGEGLGKALNSASVGGKIDVNINLSGSVSGDPGQLSKMFNSPQIQKQIMDTVLYKLNEYKRQQGVLS
jgi:hypothetical protein